MPAIYAKHFGFAHTPFSIAPDPRYLYMSERHREALAHLLYGLQGEGGIILLTGEVGTGKTTICRCLLEQIPGGTNVAFVLNPKLTARELLESICDDLGIESPRRASVKDLTDRLNRYLLDAHARGERTVAIVDEAQNLSMGVLEQLRLLTNLETNERKLLQIILLGQPELATMLARPELRQFAQRVTARYHLEPLGLDDIRHYVTHRLAVAGCRDELFSRRSLAALYKVSGGIPRLLNLLCDRALLGAYVEGSRRVTPAIVRKAATEVMGAALPERNAWRSVAAVAAVLGLALAGIAALQLLSPPPSVPVAMSPAAATADQETTATVDPPARMPAAEPEPVTAAAVPDTTADDARALREFLRRAGDPAELDTAFVDLFERWQIAYSPARHGDACDHAVVFGSDCLTRRGDWNTLRALNRPAILSLDIEDGARIFVTLTRLEGDAAVLQAAGEQARFPVAAISRWWFGDFAMLWRVPPTYYRELKPGDTGEDVAFLAEQLSIVTGNPALRRSRFDDELATTTRQFQNRSGLVADGIVGANTWIMLNTANEPGVPLLDDGRTGTPDR